MGLRLELHGTTAVGRYKETNCVVLKTLIFQIILILRGGIPPKIKGFSVTLACIDHDKNDKQSVTSVR